MKNTVLTLLCAMTITSCGNGNSQNTQNQSTANTQTEVVKTNEQAPTPIKKESNRTTIAGYLGEFGFTEDDMKLPNFTRLGQNTNLNTNEVSDVNVFVSAIASPEEKKAWAEKIINKLSAMADNGNINNIVKNAPLVFSDIDFSKNIISIAGNFTRQNKNIYFSLTITNSLDHADPDEAMPIACFSIRQG